MKILAVDTSTRMGSVALADSEQLIAQTHLHLSVTHAEKLLPAIDEILKQTGWELSALGGLAIAIGPGSFTGLRVGLATLKGFALSHNLPLVGISTLEALAHNGALSDWPVAAILDAKRGEVYAAVYQFQKSDRVSLSNCGPRVLFPEKAIQPNLLCNALKKMGPCWLIGDGALHYQKIFKESLEDLAFFPPEPLMHLQAKWIAWLALPRLQKGEGKNWASLVPNYLRLSDAEVRGGGSIY
ncbi:MAG: tRNA (adenosine(37)-N6)-threonylcarbamoyltransferase complex dimerization subunit type 1 TsaB [Deltaproteobacteria bacterium]|nr:tRNA (adenosine(37)-N6)-threonylcarbamoyltransferase complex dimerization subunit type 1 TsaB [Deltaproteobacteria bacterium]MDZ4224758.1 tRNA (adenosine(37)-N6)-threonylcarbamoyltransferase complex dimerization subunit type 1 TsaB [bacterium]